MGSNKELGANRTRTLESGFQVAALSIVTGNFIFNGACIESSCTKRLTDFEYASFEECTIHCT